MATLTEISIYTRKIIVWVGIGLVVFLFLRFIFILAVNLYKAAHPPIAAPPNVIFNKIPAPIFPADMAPSAGLNFLLENIEGKPPLATASGRVYFMPKKLPSLLAPQKAREFANTFNFTTDPQITSQTLYHFVDPTDNNRTMDLDIVNGNFQIDYNYVNDLSIFNTGSVPVSSEAINSVKGLFPIDSTLSLGPTTTTLLHYSNGQFVPVKSLSETQAIRVDFFRASTDAMNFLPPHFSSSYNYAILSGSANSNKRYLKISYIFWPIDYTNFGTYPLKNSETAWEELVAGSGWVATMGTNKKTDQIVIRKIYLAYYDSGLAENYTQPIFVFEGDKGFVAYVPAVDPNWIE